MVLKIKSDASYLSRPNSGSVAGGFHYCGNRNDDVICGVQFAMSSSIPTVCAAVSEAEYAALFINAQHGAWERTVLAALRYPQIGPTPIETDNKTAEGIAQGTCTMKRSKAIAMRYHWIRDRVSCGEFIRLFTQKKNFLQSQNETEKVLGIFARSHTFNDKSEEELIQLEFKNYPPDLPSLAEMTEAAIKFLSAKQGNFFLVVEEEGTDNFGNANNATGYFDALKRADDAIGVALNFYSKNPNTLIITAADSEAGGMEIYGFLEKDMMRDKPLPEKARNGARLMELMALLLYHF